MVEVKAYHFKYIGGSSQETRKFYQRFIRGFLRWHRTKAVWVKGGRTRREAYIIVTENLIGTLTQMLKEDESLTQEKLARRFNKQQDWVSARILLVNKLAPEVKTNITERSVMTPTQASARAILAALKNLLSSTL